MKRGGALINLIKCRDNGWMHLELVNCWKPDLLQYIYVTISKLKNNNVICCSLLVLRCGTCICFPLSSG